MGVLNPSGKIIGSGLTYPLRGYIDGLITANAADTAHDITIAEGEATDSTKATLMTLSSAMTKQIDASWSVGNGNGGLFTGSVTNSTWYHMFLIKHSNGAIDCGFDTSVTAANRPSGWTYYRRIGSVLTNGSANIYAFVQIGDTFLWYAHKQDVGITTLGTSATEYALSVPLGIRTKPIIQVYVAKSASAPLVLLSSPVVSDEAPDAGTAFMSDWCPVRGVGGATVMHDNNLITSLTSTIRARSSLASTTLYISTLGWIDPRGKE